MTALTVTLTRWRIECLVLLWRFKLGRETVKFKKRLKRFEANKARLSESLAPQEFLEYAATLRTLEQLHKQQGEHLELFMHLLRTERYTGDYAELETQVRQVVAIGMTVKP